MLYSPDDFIPAMSDLFKTCRDSGSVTMTVKPYDGQDRPEPRNGTPGKWRKQKLTLIRVRVQSRQNDFGDHSAFQKSFSCNIWVEYTILSAFCFQKLGFLA